MLKIKSKNKKKKKIYRKRNLRFELLQLYFFFFFGKKSVIEHTNADPKPLNGFQNKTEESNHEIHYNAINEQQPRTYANT